MGKMALRIAEICFLLLVVSLAWMTDPLMIGGLASFPADWLFLVTSAFWCMSLACGTARLYLHRSFWLLAIYLAAMALSIVASEDVGRSAFKLLTQAYLLSLALLTFNLVRTMEQLKWATTAWIAAAATIGWVGTLAIVTFAAAGPTSLFDWSYHNFGTLPPGPYRRLQLTFDYPAMLANYLGVALLLVFASRAEGWISQRLALLGGVAIAVSCLFTLTPGLGGVSFMVAAWMAYRLRKSRPRLATLLLAGGLAMAVVAVLLASVAPIPPRSSPFLVAIPGLPPLAPSVRLLAWTQAISKVLSSPLIGHGIGIDPVHVDYYAVGCGRDCVTDAHNGFLSMAAQCGLIGLGALFGLIAFVGRRLICAVRNGSDISVALSLAWLGSVAMQGLVGSFEDQRHLWILLGLIAAADSALSPGTHRDGPRVAPPA
jgi:O-antigen ligase